MFNAEGVDVARNYPNTAYAVGFATALVILPGVDYCYLTLKISAVGFATALVVQAGVDCCYLTLRISACLASSRHDLTDGSNWNLVIKAVRACGCRAYAAILL